MERTRKVCLQQHHYHGHLEFHDLVLRALETPRVAEIIDDIAVEWGNALYQDVVDRYARGDEVPWDEAVL